MSVCVGHASCVTVSQPSTHTRQEKFDNKICNVLSCVRWKSWQMCVFAMHAWNSWRGIWGIPSLNLGTNGRLSTCKCQSKWSLRNCENLASKKTTCEEMKHFIGQPVVCFTVEEAANTVSLSQLHYNHLCRQHNFSIPCDSVRKKQGKVHEKFTRHFPEPELIKTYLASVNDDPPHLTEQSLICGGLLHSLQGHAKAYPAGKRDHKHKC